MRLFSGRVKGSQAIGALMIVYALVIGLLVYGYADVSNCLASYADKSATSTNARAVLAAEDRALDDAVRKAQEKSDVALDNALAALVAVPNDQKKTGLAFATLVTVRREVAAVRVEANRQRAENEVQRKKSPPPPPPSQTC